MTVPFSIYLFNSIFVSLLSTTIGVMIGAMAAYPFAKKKFPGKAGLWRLIMLTLLFSGGVTALPAYIVKAKLGLINTYWVLILPSLASTLHMFLLRQFMLQIPDSLLDAGKIDGASDMRIFMNIVLPNVKPAWMTVMVLSFTNVWNNGSTGVIFKEELKLLKEKIQAAKKALEAYREAASFSFAPSLRLMRLPAPTPRPKPMAWMMAMTA